jgi:hypothetical protein
MSDDLRDLTARFTKSTTAPDLDMSLCPRCRVIDLDAVFEAAWTGEDLNGSLIARIYSDEEEWSAVHTCRFCVLLAEVWPGDDYENAMLCAFSSLAARRLPVTKGRVSGNQHVVLTLHPYYDQAFEDEDFLNLPLVLPIIRSESESASRAHSVYGARQLSLSCINYSLIKDWLRDCTSRHKECCLTRRVFLPLKVIDCLQRKIIPSVPDMRYLALSYVWGQQPKRGKESSTIVRAGELPHNIPRVILDAMKLVISLDLRYLWVDRFCIDQDKQVEKHQEISHMGDIYEGASATIIAASSGAYDDCLPGVSTSRAACHFVRISEKTSLQVLRTITKMLQSTKWNTRAWTYQEFCMSRRCLVFTDDQVHFICRRGTTCEGVEQAVLSELPADERRCLDPRILHEDTRLDAPTFHRHLSAYSKRTLSYDIDGLNAFRGILSRSQSATYWGVPIFKSDSAPDSAIVGAQHRALTPFHQGFSVGLAWATGYDSTGRRHGLPSWSWVSSRDGDVHYQPMSFMTRNDDLWYDHSKIECCAEVFLQDPANSDQQSISARTNSTGVGSHVIPEISPYIYIRSVVKAIPTEVWSEFRKHVSWDCGEQPESLKKPLELILLFCTKEANFGSCYMVIATEGDTARRVGLVIGVNRTEVESLVTVHEMKTIKVG